MSERQAKLEAQRLAVIQKSMSTNRSRSPGTRSRSLSPHKDQLKWSIINHDPLERFVYNQHGPDSEDRVNIGSGGSFEEPSEEENISDDNEEEKFHYDDTGNILPNYAFHDEPINEVSNMLESQNLNDKSVVKQLEEVTASERALANAKISGTPLDETLVQKLNDLKQELTGKEVDLDRVDQELYERKKKLEDYASYRKKVIDHENEKYRDHDTGTGAAGSNAATATASSTGAGAKGANPSTSASTEAGTDSNFMIPYTSAIEDKIDSEFASQLNETIIESAVDSNKAQSRVIQTITRGNFFQLIDPSLKPKMFLLCMDFSPELIFALEWSLGTVLVDGAVLFIVCVIEDTDSNHQLKGNTANETTRETTRLEMLNKAKQLVLNLLRLTKLQIHVVIEIIHHPIPRHLILEIIDNLQPTLVIVGSKGQSAIKGVLLGSLSNYLVTKSSVPVMVVREKLKKINRFKNGSSVFSNNIKPLTLSEARID